MAPGSRLVVTVPGGPRSAFDRHIGHIRHFTAGLLGQVLADAGLVVERVLRAGFPFHNLYKLAIIARGRRFITEFEGRDPEARPSPLERAAWSFFRTGLAYSRDDSPLGWQLAAVARVPDEDRDPRN
jgi:hypothetical protein